MKKKPTCIDEYLAELNEDQRLALENLRKVIHAVAPNAEECISYQLPAFKQNRMLVSFGATKKHCAFYVMSSSVLDEFQIELEGFDVSKGTIRFQPDAPIPKQLVKQIVKARIAENKKSDQDK